MKKVLLEVKEKQYDFFIELVKNLDFVHVVEEDNSKETTIKMIAEGMHAAELASQGKVETRSAKAFLNEL